jgi:hypothetical protein
MDDTGVAWTLVGTAAGPDNVAARVLSGFGIGLVFASAAELRPVEGIRYVPVVGDQPVIERVLFWRSDTRHPALAPFVGLGEIHLRDGWPAEGPER